MPGGTEAEASSTARPGVTDTTLKAAFTTGGAGGRGGGVVCVGAGVVVIGVVGVVSVGLVSVGGGSCEGTFTSAAKVAVVENGT